VGGNGGFPYLWVYLAEMGKWSPGGGKPGRKTCTSSNPFGRLGRVLEGKEEGEKKKAF